MTREEFEEKLTAFGWTFSEEMSSIEWGTYFSPREREKLRAEIMAEYDRLSESKIDKFGFPEFHDTEEGLSYSDWAKSFPDSPAPTP